VTAVEVVYEVWDGGEMDEGGFQGQVVLRTFQVG